MRVVVESEERDHERHRTGSVDVMDNAYQQGDPDRPVGGNSVHVRDCRIWAEINYLDSPTDYREYLPVDRNLSRHHAFGDPTVFDTDKRHLSEGWTGLLLLVLSMIFLLICTCLLTRANLL